MTSASRMDMTAMASDPGAWALTPLVHGGDLAAARRMFPDAPEPFVDLSTGINPEPYPMPSLPPDVFARLPEPSVLEELGAIAAKAYGAPSAAHVVVAPGVQMLLPLVASLVPRGRAAVLAPTYSEHARAAALAGHAVTQSADLAWLSDADLAVVVNPNNPDGHLVAADALRGLAARLAMRGGLLVVDEAFMDVGPVGASLAGDVGPSLLVLRSFGKFFGLAGLRLGFALAAPAPAARLRAILGPWPVAGAAVAVGMAALADASWMAVTRLKLASAAQRLDRLLLAAGLEIIGGTSLYRLARASRAPFLFDHLGRAGILVRRFADAPHSLRFGLPAEESACERLRAALADARR
jgi:cobalamin biosynthesis protein CobC